jgi:hypothetical protein
VRNAEDAPKYHGLHAARFHLFPMKTVFNDHITIIAAERGVRSSEEENPSKTDKRGIF